MLHVRRRCEERGAESDLMAVAGFSALIHFWWGKFSDAAVFAQEAVERAEQLGGKNLLVIPLTIRAEVGAHLGQLREARADAHAVIDISGRCISPRSTEWPMATLGFVEVSLGNYAEAVTIMEPLVLQVDTIPDRWTDVDRIHTRGGRGTRGHGAAR